MQRLFLVLSVSFFFSGAVSNSAQAAKAKVKPADKQAEAAARAAVDKLQTVWDAAKTYQADFTQVVFAKRLGTRDESKGSVQVVKPSKLRWETDTGGVQILNGPRLTVIQINKRRGTKSVDIYDDVSKSMDIASLKFLSGRAKFRDLYEIKLISEAPEKIELKFIPKKDQTETLIAEIDKKSYELRALTTEAVDSRVRIDFLNTKTNLDIDDKQFVYEPAPTDVVHKQK